MSGANRITRERCGAVVTASYGLTSPRRMSCRRKRIARLSTDKNPSNHDGLSPRIHARIHCIVSGRCRPATRTSPPAGICPKGISPAQSRKASVSRIAGQSGANEAFGNGAFGNTASGIKRISITIWIIFTGIPSSMDGRNRQPLGLIQVSNAS